MAINQQASIFCHNRNIRVYNSWNEYGMKDLVTTFMLVMQNLENSCIMYKYWLGRVLISLHYCLLSFIIPWQTYSIGIIFSPLLQWLKQCSSSLTRHRRWEERRWGGWLQRGDFARLPQSRNAGASVWSCPLCGSSSPCRGWSSCCNIPRLATWHWESPVTTLSRMSVTLITSPVTGLAHCPPGSWETNCSWTRWMIWTRHPFSCLPPDRVPRHISWMISWWSDAVNINTHSSAYLPTLLMGCGTRFRVNLTPARTLTSDLCSSFILENINFRKRVKQRSNLPVVASDGLVSYDEGMVKLSAPRIVTTLNLGKIG